MSHHIDPKLAAMSRLIGQALRAPPDVTEIRNDDGQRLRIDRDSEPGVELRLTPVDAVVPASAWVALSIRAVDERPAAYPMSVPFLPGIAAFLTQAVDGIWVTWRGPASGSVSVPPLPKELPTTALEELTASNADGPSLTKVQAAVDALGPGFQATARDWLRVAAPGQDVVRDLERIQDLATQASLDDGWRVVKTEDVARPFRIRTVQLERDGSGRSIVLIAGLQAASMVVLMPMPRAPGTAA